MKKDMYGLVYVENNEIKGCQITENYKDLQNIFKHMIKSEIERNEKEVTINEDTFISWIDEYGIQCSYQLITCNYM